MAIPNEQQTLDALHSEEQFTIRINPNGNPNYKTERVFVNGVCIRIPVGEDVKVSKTVRDLLIRRHII